MYLALQITGQHASAFGTNSSKVFDQRGGTVGRGSHNDWVLPDRERFISTQHFIIRCLNGVFYLEDVSTNGVFINGSTERVRDSGDAVMLNNGDRIAVGNFDIVASIVADQPASGTASPAGGVSAQSPGHAVPPAPSAADPSAPSGPVDPLAILGTQPAPAMPERPATYGDHAPAVSQHFEPPGAPPPQNIGAIPDDFELTGFSTGEPAAPAEVGAAAFQIPDDDMLVTGQPAVSAPPSIGPKPQPGQGVHAVNAQLMSVIVQGLMEILRARSEIKSQFRVPVTSLKPVENNPLKFTVSAESAMAHLFGNPEPGFMKPEAAFVEGFRDIKAHQLAMMAGMRAAFEQMLDRFDPRILERQFSAKAKGGSLMGMTGKGKYWDQYRQMFAELTQDSEDNFNRLFGEAFAHAYEQQMQKLLRGG